MNFSSLFWRVYAGFVGLIVATAVIIAVLAGHRLESESWAALENELFDKAMLLRSLATADLASNDTESLRLHVDRLADRLSPNSRLSVFESDGTVVADTHMDPHKMDNHRDRPEFVEAVRDGEGRSHRYSTTLKVEMVYFAVVVRDASDVIGVVRAALPRQVIDRRLASLHSSVVLGAAIALAAALILAFVLARLLTGPMIELSRAAASIADGDYAQRVRLRRGDELGQLAESFNFMASELESRIATLTNEHAKLGAILGAMPEGIIAIDAEERVLHMNRVAARLLDAELESSVGRRIWEVTRVSELCQTVTTTLEDGVGASVEVILHRGDQDLRIEIHTTPIVDAAGERVGVVAVVQDLTTLKRLEVMRTDFVTNVSHELKTPITAIQGLADTMSADPEMPAEVRNRFLARVTAQSRVLASLVTDLLTLARLESEEGMLERASVDPGAVIELVAQRAKPLADDKGIELEVEREAVGNIHADEELLRVAVNNLVENAIKYNPEGTRVSLRLTPGKDSVLIEVADDGVGIDPVHLDRIFERFYRVDKARSRELGGTGLGLAIVKHICRSHGGDVELKSQPGQGSTFMLRIPVRPE